METNQDSVESQVETLEKQKLKSPEKFVIKDDAQADKRITVKAD